MDGPQVKNESSDNFKPSNTPFPLLLPPLKPPFSVFARTAVSDPDKFPVTLWMRVVCDARRLDGLKTAANWGGRVGSAGVGRRGCSREDPSVCAKWRRDVELVVVSREMLGGGRSMDGVYWDMGEA